MSKKEKDPWVRIINVSDPVLHKKGYTLYKVTSKVFPKNSVEAVSEVIVWKRYNDFKKLHKALSSLHQNLYLKDTFPAFAKARFFGRFDDSVIEERRQSALQLLQFAATHSPLFTSQIFVKFFEGGHIIEENKLSSEIKCKENILQPEKNVLKTSNLHSTIEDDKKVENNISDLANTLGGTWQHHQLPDNISLGSHCTEDDDHTTFTDDESLNSRPSLDLSEFDPLYEISNDGSQSKMVLTSKDSICNNWILSALQSCNNMDAEIDVESTLEFPVPFGEIDCSEDSITPSNDFNEINNVNLDSKEEHFTFDEPSKESKKYSNDFEDDLYNCDEFATTPNSCKAELQKRPSFVANASKFVVCAKEAEKIGKYLEAFESYKKAIDLLLQGIQKDNCPELKDAVKKKILLYLMHAEEIYESKLPELEKRERYQLKSSILRPIDKAANLQGCIEDLNKYKVLGVLSKVLLVLDISTNTTYVVKTLCKSSSPKHIEIPHIVPQNIPFMVKLFKVYETSYAIYLIMQHATGGKLWDYVSSFLHRSPLSPCNDGSCLYLESKVKNELSNVYSGKKIHEETTENCIISSYDSDLTPSKNCPSSYVALFKHYAASVQKEDNVALAKYHKNSQTPSSNLFSNDEPKDGLISFSTKIYESKQDTLTHDNTLTQQNKNIRNRLSSSTGSLETALSQKACVFEVFNDMDKVISLASLKPNLHLPESCICLWAAEIVVALECLHNLGITWMDFRPENILLGAEGHILLTYQCQWGCVDRIINENATENFFCAPEVGNVFPVSVDCDWWSTGAILYELLTGRSLVSIHPTGITRHSILNFPSDISPDAKDFISKLLQFNPTERLGSGVYGIEEIKSHPFFRTIDWESLY